MKRRTVCWNQTANAALAALTIFAAGACSGGSAAPSGSQNGPSLQGETGSNYQIRFFTGTGADTQMVTAGPDSTIWKQPEGAPSAGGTTMSLRTTTQSQTNGVQTQSGTLAPQSIVIAAMVECGLKATSIAKGEFPDSTSFYHMKNLLPRSFCDNYLEAQQILVCAADKLAEVSEGTAPVVWQVAGVGSDTGIILPAAGPYTFPPQDPTARFILRDLALHTLAHVVWLDVLQPTGTATGTTCTDLYAKDAASPNQADLPSLFGISTAGSALLANLPTFDSAKLSGTAGIATLSAERLAFKAHVLRAAARMIPELVTDSVYADLGGATQRKEAQGDFARGLRALWGNFGDGYYNSLAHAARVLSQRWQLPVSSLAPWQNVVPASTCSTIPLAQDALEQVYGDDYTARVGSLPATTDSRSDAIARLDRTGVVFDDTALQGADASNLKQDVLNQLVHAAYVDSGLASSTSESDYKNGPSGQRMLATFDGVSDQDFLFAAKTVQDRYRVLANAGTAGWDSTATASENMDSAHLLSTNPAGMHVLRDPLVKTDLAIDVTAKLGGIQTVSQCTETVRNPLAMGTDYDVEFATQDSFSMGQALYSRLVKLRELSATASTDAKTVADAATAEVRAWSGEGRIFAVATGGLVLPGRRSPVASIQLTTLGFEPKDFGADSTEEMADRLELVWGKPYIADCAAGLRTTCPSNVDEYVAKPSQTTVVSLSSDNDNATVSVPNSSGQMSLQSVATARKFYGVDGTWGSFVFDLANPSKVGTTGSQFHPTFSGSNLTQRRLYVVVTSDPNSPSGAGKVLGAISLRQPGQYTSLVVSKMQRELYNAVFGINHNGLLRPTLTGARSLAESDKYCLPGVPYDIFVPLENELTSDGDPYESSWKTLLQQAKDAAAEADQLGDKMLDWGLQTEMRREDANSKLADVCGSYGLVDDTTFNDGDVSAGPTDGPLAACTNNDAKNVVFLGKAPDDLKKTTTPADVTDYLKNSVLNCNGNNPTQNKSGLCAYDTLSYGELALPDLGEYQSDSFECSATDVLAKLMRGGFPGPTLELVKSADWRDPDRLQGLADALQYVEDIPHGDSHTEWYVLWNRSTTLMSSTGLPENASDQGQQKTIWPGCKLGGTCNWNDRLTAKFDQMFGTDSKTGMTTGDIATVGWRVQGALWTIGAMAGTVPKGMFTVRLPVANFNAAANGESLLVPAIYGIGTLASVGAGFKLETTASVVPEDVANNRFGTAYAYPGDFTNPAPDPSLQPTWLTEFWSKAQASNEASGGKAYLTVTSGDSDEVALGGRSALSDDIDKMAAGFNHMRCPGFLFDEPGTDGSDSETARAKLEEIKTTARDAWGRICRPPNGGKQGPLTLVATGGRNVAVVFQDVVLATKCTENVTGYGTSNDLFPTGAPVPTIPGAPDKGLSHWWYMWVGNACAERTQYGNVAMTSDCLNSWVGGQLAAPLEGNGAPTIQGNCDYAAGWDPADPYKGAFALGPWYLRPDNCSKGARARMFINSYPPATACDAAAQLVAALGLACELQGQPPPADLSNPPNLQGQDGLDHLAELGAWVNALGVRMANQASHMYVEDVPSSVLTDFGNGTVGTGSNAGTIGQAKLQMGTSLQQIRDSWRHVGETLALIGHDIAGARISGKLAQEQLTQQSLNNAIARINSLAQAEEAVARGIGAWFAPTTLFNPGSAAAESAVAEVEVLRASFVDDAISALEVNAQNQYNDSVAQTLNDLQSKLLTRTNDLEDSLSALKAAVAAQKQSASQIDNLTSTAQYEAAVAAGADFARDSDGNAISIPVNTVLNRQYDVTRNRYRKALAQARYLAFLSRVAIEQRLGERLDAVSFPTTTGPLESPGLWADDVCHMTGIDFSKYKDAPLPDWAKENPSMDGGTGSKIIIPPSVLDPKYRRNLLALFSQDNVIDDLSKQYIGDYVSKLESFVTYYNTEYPSHDGDDTTVLSLRDDLLTRDKQCYQPSVNLLYFSGALDRSALAADGSGQVLGWQTDSCDLGVQRCIRVMGSSGLAGIIDPPVPNAGVSVLTEEPARTVEVDAGGLADGGAHDGANVGTAQPFEPRTVNQQMHLAPGSYVLSWWDSARTSADSLSDLAQQVSTMTVAVSDAGGQSVGMWQGQPQGAAGVSSGEPDAGDAAAAGWSPRRSFGFYVAQDGVYTLSISVSLGADQPATVAIAGVQLEKTASASAPPSAYEDTGATRSLPSQSCVLTSQDVENAFDYECDSTGQCFYELRAPITLDTQDLQSHPDYLNGKLAEGNFNYRHVTLALNLVGTGLVDCSGQPATCRDTNTVDYRLAHDAFEIQFRGVNGALRDFNFGEAFINDGRALASEIEIETPVTAEYNALLQQDGVTKTEYMGRPLDGTYRLRIWDRPGLQWNRLKDVQIVLKYRYWSAIQKSSSGPT